MYRERGTPDVLTVSQLNRYVKSVLDGDPNLQEIFLSGEISNFTNHYRSGHLYFSLKDSRSAIKAVMFASAARRLRFLPEDGMQVIVRGRAALYEQGGQYQFYIEEMQPEGIGALNFAFEQLKEKLFREGLFLEERKRPLPRYPQRIGVITSPTGAAIQDILQILARRWPVAEVVFCPVLVQGDGAAPQIAEAIRRFNACRAADVLIVGRGGGSIEDLWAFNEEPVARAVAASEIPVISAVGHETDFTICDFAADLRAPTPSAAAELATPEIGEEAAQVAALEACLRERIQAQVRSARDNLRQLSATRVIREPIELIQMRRMAADHLSSRFAHAARETLSGAKTRLADTAGRLDAMSPLKVLQRGYAVVTKEGAAVREIGMLCPGDRIEVLLSGGKAGCDVVEVGKETQNGKSDDL